MEYYAKSPTFVLKEQNKKEILKKLESVIDVFYDELEEQDGCILQDYKEKLLKKNIKVEHKTLIEHLQDIVKCAYNFFELYGEYFSEKEKKLIIDACKLHDIGKANYIFQTKVNPKLKKEKTPQIPHGFLSAIILSKKAFLQDNPQYNSEDFNILLTAIYYHHNRKDIYKADEIKHYCERFYIDNIKQYLKDDNVGIHISNRNFLLFSDQKSRGTVAVNEDVWCKYMLIKGMLNKFDWTVSAGYENAEIATDMIEKKLCHNIEIKWVGNFKPAQQFMIENKDNNVIIIAPTGSGKTEAALMWINGEKGFYTLPLKVSSNAIYKRIKEEYQYQDVALLHSDSMNSYLKESEEGLENGYKNYEQAKLFSYPLTVCTVDQLFKFVYKALGTEIFAATLKYSKIVIDEIQSYSPRIVAALIFGLSEIKRMGGKFAIITATFPPVLKYFMKKSGLLETRDYVWHDFSDNELVKRHRLQVIEGDFDIDEIVQTANEKKVLIICNTVSKAQHIYQEMNKEEIKAGLLHSRFIRKHRNILEKNIMDFSNDETATGIWITTQIVEASLDIDFDILYTEMCTADSLLQRMGRCNRKGKKDTSYPNIIIYHNCSGRGSVYDKDIYDRSINSLKRKDGQLFSEVDKVSYINDVYDIEQIQDTKYFSQIEKNIQHFRELKPTDYDDKEAQKDFRDIKSITVIPDTIYNQNYEIIQSIKELMEISHVGKSIRKLLKMKIADMTLSLNSIYRIPDGIDKDTIGFFDIHRTRLKYDFDGNRGCGLLLDKVEDEDYFV